MKEEKREPTREEKEEADELSKLLQAGLPAEELKRLIEGTPSIEEEAEQHHEGLVAFITDLEKRPPSPDLPSDLDKPWNEFLTENVKLAKERLKEQGVPAEKRKNFVTVGWAYFDESCAEVAPLARLHPAAGSMPSRLILPKIYSTLTRIRLTH